MGTTDLNVRARQERLDTGYPQAFRTWHVPHVLYALKSTIIDPQVAVGTA